MVVAMPLPDQLGELSGYGDAFDDYVFLWHIAVATGTAGLDQLDLVDHIHTFGDGTEHAVAPALGRFVSEVQIIVIDQVDEELGAGRVRIAGEGHRQSAD